jgi:glucose-1-phosphate thymidylyltransferase
MRKGIILAGGKGQRLGNITKYVCKQLLPIYDKPMIYYPLYTLIKCGIKDILIISTPETTPILEKSLGNGKEYGCSFHYKVQETPNGLAQAFVLGEEFIGKDKVCLILGDNIFYGNQCEKFFKDSCKSNDNTIFGYPVSDPERYGVVEFDENDNVISIEEKPKTPKSNYAVPGIYFYNNDVIEIAKNLKPSARGEYEITDVNKEYLKRKNLKVKRLGFGNAYLDTGTFQSLNDASNFVRTIQERTGLKVSDLEIFKK